MNPPRLHQIDVDDDVMAVLKTEAEAFVDTPNSVIRRLLGVDKNGAAAAASAGPGPQTENVKQRHAKAKRKATPAKASRARPGSLLPESEYELPILQYLVDHDGRAPSREVVESLAEVLGDRLTDADKQPLNSGDIRWKSRAAFVRLRLVEAGDLNGHAPRGTWEITDKGRRRVQDAA